MSINRIITCARIPRGSFYQYFADKEDMIRCLLVDLREYFIDLIQQILVESGGDLLAFPLGAFDRFMVQSDPDPMLARFIRILRLNQGIDTQTFLSGSPGLLPDPLWEVVDVSRLRQSSREFADHLFYFTCAALACAVVDTLRDPAGWQRYREDLYARIDLLRRGCAVVQEKEEHP